MHHDTQVDIYEMMDSDEVLKQAEYNNSKGVNYISLVTSGRKVSDKNLKQLTEIGEDILRKTNLKLCSSLGLLEEKQLSILKQKGFEYYHCNLETARSFFLELCTTHTYDEKIKTIKSAQRVGLKVCSGGILGMGETMEQRIELAFELRNLGIKSIPLNFLIPIEGTPLFGVDQLTEEEILISLAMFRIINPDAKIRLAAGRKLYYNIQEKVLKAGVNAAIVGDLLTTLGADMESDIKNFKKAGFDIGINI